MNHTSSIQEVIARQRDAYCTGATAPQKCILSGSFNPLHRAHRRMAELAASLVGLPVEFEISIANVDKPSLTVKEVERRLLQFPDDVVWVTNAPTFADKARLFPGCRFVIGADTALRLFDEKYYAAVSERDAAIALLAECDCRFIVFGRYVKNQFLAAETIEIPEFAGNLFAIVPESRFRDDISSTELRRNSHSG